MWELYVFVRAPCLSNLSGAKVKYFCDTSWTLSYMERVWADLCPGCIGSTVLPSSRANSTYRLSICIFLWPQEWSSFLICSFWNTELSCFNGYLFQSPPIYLLFDGHWGLSMDSRILFAYTLCGKNIYNCVLLKLGNCRLAEKVQDSWRNGT